MDVRAIDVSTHEDVSGIGVNTRYPIMKNGAAEITKCEALIGNLARCFTSAGRDLVQDLMQEGRLALVEYSTTWDPSISTLWTYANRRVFGAMLDAFARERPHGVDRSAFPIDEDGEIDIPDSPGLSADDSADLANALDALTEIERDLIRLYVVEDLTFEQIETKLGVDDATIKRRYRDACQKVRSQLEAA